MQFEEEGSNHECLQVHALKGSFMLTCGNTTKKVGKKQKQKLNPGQYLVFEDGEAYEVYRNVEAHA